MVEELDTRLRSVKMYVEENSERITFLVDQLVKKYNNDLDDFISVIKDKIVRKDKLSINEIENLCLKVPIFMYFSSNGVENIGIQMDNAKSIRSTKYNEEYISAHGTVGDKTAEAENEVIPEGLMVVVYERAYKKLKQKLEICELLCRASNKVLQSRMNDLEIHKMTPDYLKDDNDRRDNKDE